jgi:hypothetical protein
MVQGMPSAREGQADQGMYRRNRESGYNLDAFCHLPSCTERQFYACCKIV